MDKEEIKKTILRRFYEGVMKHGTHYQFWFDTFQQEIGIDAGLELRIYEELSADGFFGDCFVNRVVCPSAKALLYCEQHGLADPTTVKRNEEIRKRILEVCSDMYDENLSMNGEYWGDICQRAKISRSVLEINIGVLTERGVYEKDRPSFNRSQISLKGRDLVKELRKRRERLSALQQLGDPIDVTRQVRGHRLEDLLAEVIADEGWRVSKRVQPQGMEYDLVFNKDLIYFLASCKWEGEPIQGVPVQLLITRSEGPGYYAGVFFSMSGYTSNCIVLTKERKTNQKILLFGPGDVESLFSHAEEIFSENQWFNDLLDEKIKKLIHKNIILVDGVSN